MKVAVVSEYYPRVDDTVLGIWAHRQALAARDAGADVRVLVLHRPVPPRAALRERRPAALACATASTSPPWAESTNGCRMRLRRTASPAGAA